MGQNLKSRPLSRINFLGKPLLIMPNHLPCALHNLRRRAKIRIQHHPFGLGVILLKIQHNLRLRSPKTVNRLIIIPHNKQIILRRRQKAHNIILKLIDILKLIHQNIAVLPLPRPQNIRPLPKKLIAVHQHIIKVNQIAPAQPIVVIMKNPLKYGGIADRCMICIQIAALILHPADLRRHIGNKFRLIVRLQLRLLHTVPQKPVLLLLPENIFRPIAVSHL